ncbi:MAG: hypothetical protein ACUVRK_12530 [Spirochaetota bacterium]
MKDAQLFIYREYEEPFQCATMLQIDECDRLVAAIKYFGVLIPAEIFDDDRGI